MPRYNLRIGNQRIPVANTDTPLSQALGKRLASSSPETNVDSAGSGHRYEFGGQQLDYEDLRDIKDIRDSGGQVAQLMQYKALLNFGEGAEIHVEDNDETEQLVDGQPLTLQEWLEQEAFPKLDLLVLDLGEDALWYPYAVGEIQETVTGDFKRALPAEPWTMIPREDDRGEIEAWHQRTQNGSGGYTEQLLNPDDIWHIVLNKASARDKTGISEVLRNHEEIQAFKQNEQAINQAIELHGFPQRHIKVGREDGAPVSDDDLRRVRTIFDPHTSDANTAYFTGQDVNVETLEAHNFDYSAIHEMDMRNLTTALGLPLEAGNVGSDGLGSGKPAELRFALLKLAIKANQRSFSTQFVEKVMRPVIRDYSPFDHTATVTVDIADPLEDIGEVADLLGQIGDYMTNDEARRKLDLPEPEDDEIGESYRSPADIEKAEEEGTSDDGPFGGMFSETLANELDARGLTASRARTLQEDFDASLFELVATEDQEDFETGARLGVGVEFPNSGVYVDWNIDAWPEEERLDGPHVSDYATIDDAQKVAQGEVRELSADAVAGDTDFRCLGVGERDLQHAPEWDRPLLEMYQGVSNPASDPTRTLVSFAASDTPEFVLERIREAIMSGAIFSDIDGVSGDELMDFRQEFADTVGQGNFSIDDVTETIMDFTGEDRQSAEVAARTELGNTLKVAREQGYAEEAGDGERFYWTGADPGDSRQTDCCGYLIAGEGGHLENPGAFSSLDHPQGTNPFEGGDPLPMKELKQLVADAARADPEIDTEPRTWTPHIQCRSTFVLAPSEGV